MEDVANILIRTRCEEMRACLKWEVLCIHKKRAGIFADPCHVHIHLAFVVFFVFFVPLFVVFLVFFGPHVPHPIRNLLPG